MSKTKISGITRMRTPFEQAAPVKKKILADAVAERDKRKESSVKDTYQASKEAATYLVHAARGRITIGSGKEYTCFECLNRLKDPCRFCRNGSHYFKKGA